MAYYGQVGVENVEIKLFERQKSLSAKYSVNFTNEDLIEMAALYNLNFDNEEWGFVHLYLNGKYESYSVVENDGLIVVYLIGGGIGLQTFFISNIRILLVFV